MILKVIICTMRVAIIILTHFYDSFPCRIRSVFMRRSAMEIKKSRLDSMKPLEFLPEVNTRKQTGAIMEQSVQDFFN